MSTELYIPTISGKLGTEFYRESETFRRRSAASKAKMAKYWSDGRHRRRVDKKQAKPVAAYRLDGTFVGWYKSARKAAIALYPGQDYHMNERGVRACRQCKNGKWAKRQCKGYMFRDWTGNTSNIAPYVKRTKTRQKRGYKKDNTYLCKPCMIVFNDGDTIRFDSLKECAAALKCAPSGISRAVNHSKTCKGFTIKLINP